MMRPSANSPLASAFGRRRVHLSGQAIDECQVAVPSGCLRFRPSFEFGAPDPQLASSESGLDAVWHCASMGCERCFSGQRRKMT